MVMATGVPPDTFEYQWVAAVVRATEQRSGVASRWNGQVFVEPEHAGSALEDGGLAVDQEILDLVAKAYRGDELDEDEIGTLREGVATVVHESDHLTSWPGDLQAPGVPELYADDVVALEEGLAEDFAQNTVDDIIRDIKMDQVVPGLTGREQSDSSPAYTAGTDQLVEGLAQIGKVDPAYVRQNLRATGRVQRWDAAAEFVINQRLNGLVPDEHRSAVRGQLVDAMRTQFAPLKALHDSDRSDVDKAIAGHQLGRQTVAALNGALNHERDRMSEQPRVQEGPEISADRWEAERAAKGDETGLAAMAKVEAALARVEAKYGKQDVAQLQKFLDGPAVGSQTVQAKAGAAHRPHERPERGSARG